MCYCNCTYEFYPNGPNEGCACRKPKDGECIFDIPEKECPVTDEDGDDYGS